VQESCPHGIAKLCVQFAAITVGPVNVVGHPVETGAAFVHTNVPAAFVMFTRGHP
jgi:hypothetical protein